MGKAGEGGGGGECGTYVVRNPVTYGTPKWSKIGQRIAVYCGVYLNTPLRHCDRSSERSIEQSNKSTNKHSLDRSNECSRNPSNERSQDHSLDRSHKWNITIQIIFTRSYLTILMNVHSTCAVRIEFLKIETLLGCANVCI